MLRSVHPTLTIGSPLCRLVAGLMMLAVADLSTPSVFGQELSEVADRTPLQIPTEAESPQPTDQSGDVAGPKRTSGDDPAGTTDEKPRLGVIVLDSPGRGVFVAAIDPFGPAMRAGLRPGDYLLKLNGVEVSSPDELRKELVKHRPDDQVEIMRWRCGVESLHVAKLSRPRLLERLVTPAAPNPWLGVTLSEVEGHGVRIASVIVGSPAASAGISPGDVVVSADGKEIKDVNDLVKAVRKRKPNEEMSLVLRRSNQKVTVKAKLGSVPRRPDSFFRGPLQDPFDRLRERRPWQFLGPSGMEVWH